MISPSTSLHSLHEKSNFTGNKMAAGPGSSKIDKLIQTRFFLSTLIGQEITQFWPQTNQNAQVQTQKWKAWKFLSNPGLT